MRIKESPDDCTHKPCWVSLGVNARLLSVFTGGTRCIGVLVFRQIELRFNITVASQDFVSSQHGSMYLHYAYDGPLDAAIDS